MMKLRLSPLLLLLFVLLQCVLPLAHSALGYAHPILSDYHLHPQTIESHCEEQSNTTDWQAYLRHQRWLSQPVMLVAALSVRFEVVVAHSLPPVLTLLPRFSPKHYPFTWSQAPPERFLLV